MYILNMLLKFWFEFLAILFQGFTPRLCEVVCKGIVKKDII